MNCRSWRWIVLAGDELSLQEMNCHSWRWIVVAWDELSYFCLQSFNIEDEMSHPYIWNVAQSRHILDQIRQLRTIPIPVLIGVIITTKLIKDICSNTCIIYTVQYERVKTSDDCAQFLFSEFLLTNQFKPLIGHPVKRWELNVSVRSCR